MHVLVYQTVLSTIQTKKKIFSFLSLPSSPKKQTIRKPKHNQSPDTYTLNSILRSLQRWFLSVKPQIGDELQKSVTLTPAFCDSDSIRRRGRGEFLLVLGLKRNLLSDPTVQAPP